MKPIPISDALLAFPADVSGLIPPWKEIPERYRDHANDSEWFSELFSTLFFKGLKSLSLMPREGIDAELAWRHIRAIMGSYQPKHEHKEAACRYLLDLWFTGATWT